jgi:hypothetical protein
MQSATGTVIDHLTIVIDSLAMRMTKNIDTDILVITLLREEIASDMTIEIHTEENIEIATEGIRNDNAAQETNPVAVT